MIDGRDRQNKATKRLRKRQEGKGETEKQIQRQRDKDRQTDNSKYDPLADKDQKSGNLPMGFMNKHAHKHLQTVDMMI